MIVYIHRAGRQESGAGRASFPAATPWASRRGDEGAHGDEGEQQWLDMPNFSTIRGDSILSAD